MTPSLLFAVGVSLTATSPLSAQTVINACYNSNTGVLYVIDPTGTSTLPTACVNPKHVLLSFVDGAGAVFNGDVAGGDLGGTFPNPSVVKLQGNAVDASSPSDGQILAWDGSSSAWKPTTSAGGGGVTDHGALTGLEDNDHPQYQLRVVGTCPPGSSIQVIDEFGAVTCETDDDTQYAAGFGLLLETNSFSVNPADVQRRVVSTCPLGSSIRAIAEDGTLTCELGGGVTDHGALTGLEDDDHPQYVLADGSRVMSTLTATGNVFAPIFYDGNNTTYYLDPASAGTSARLAGDVLTNGDVTAGNLAATGDVIATGDVSARDVRATGCVEAGATVLGGVCSSDERLKKDIVSLPNVLDRVSQLRPVQFDWRVDEFPERGFSAERQTGLIAQEVEQVFPEMVVDDDDGYKRVRYSDLPMLVLQAVKELEGENRELRAANDRLRVRLDRLEAALRVVSR